MSFAMETEGVKAIVKPDRFPDYITPWGAAFWWPEMVYMGRDSTLFNMRIEEETGKLRSYTADGAANRYFPVEVRDLYDKWMYDTFESKLLGESDD